MIKELTREEFIKKYEWVPKDVEVYLENAVTLFRMDWNGEVYRKGFQITPTSYNETGKNYKPIYSELDEYGDCDILGWEEE